VSSAATENLSPSADLTEETLWRKRITAAEEDPARKKAESAADMSLAYVAQEQWVVVDRESRRLVDIADLDERYRDVDLVVSDIILERRGAALGELEGDNERPEFLAPGNAEQDSEEESVQAQVNRALGHAWDFETDADTRIADAYQKCLDLGVSAIRVRYDKQAGKRVQTSAGEPVDAPVGPDGNPIMDAEKARAYVADTAAQGGTASLQAVHEGKIVLQVGSLFNLLTPPGVPHEKDFPWEIWRAPALLDEVKAVFPGARDLVPDGDIGSVLGTTNANGKGRLSDHVWLYTCFERPSRSHPKGRVAVLASSRKVLLQTRPELPYQTVDGEWCSGVVYYHWWRLTDRFWSLSLVDTLKESQRLTNRTATQTQEIIDRSMPFGITTEDQMPEEPSGKPMEWVKLKNPQGAPPPQWLQGPGPGPWMREHREQLIEDADRASTISALRLGENPPNVDTYGQLQTLHEQEAGKRSSIRAGVQRSNAKLAEFMLVDITRYWPESKQVLVAGGEADALQAHEFSKSVIPPMYVVRPAKGAAKLRTQGAQIQMINDISLAAVNYGATATNPLAWVEWYKQSLDAGEPLELPAPPTDNQQETAEKENHALLAGDQPAVAYYDNHALHIPVHRQAQDQARLAGDSEAFMRVEEHIVEHQTAALEAQAKLAAQGQPATPGLSAPQPGLPPAPASGPPVPPA
jgi:hypothetical protein